jgi:hypothetical protein
MDRWPIQAGFGLSGVVRWLGAGPPFPIPESISHDLCVRASLSRQRRTEASGNRNDADVPACPPSRIERGQGGATTFRILTGGWAGAQKLSRFFRFGNLGCPILVFAQFAETGWDYNLSR